MVGFFTPPGQIVFKFLLCLRERRAEEDGDERLDPVGVIGIRGTGEDGRKWAAG